MLFSGWLSTGATIAKQSQKNCFSLSRAAGNILKSSFYFLRMIQIFAHDAASKDELCIWHLLLSSVFLFFLQDAHIFVFLCLKPGQSLMMFVFCM